ncbi:MAG: glycosyltransferase family 4 protein [Actinobacteria bacterium]|nr:MAG: glycosyltransferase family 4 protein [Actinomycetota bacterium]
MRILVLTNMYPPHHYGGYELSCYDTVERLRAHGHRVTVLTTTLRLPGVADRRDERTGGVRRDLAFYWDDHRLLSPSLPERLKIERANQLALENAISAERPEVVSVWNMGAMSFGLLTTIIEKQIPLVYMVCDDWLLYGPKLDAWSRLFPGRGTIARAVRRLTGVPTSVPELGRSGAFLFVSDVVRQAAAKTTPEAARNGSVVYSGIDRRFFPPLAGGRPRRAWRWRLLYAGRLDQRKGIHVALDALSFLPDEAILEIRGRGDSDYLSTLREQAARLGVEGRVRFSDHSARTDLHKAYMEADVVVFPVLWSEPFGLVPLEAMACGIPVVATGTGGSGEYLRDGANCLLSPPGDATALAKAVRRLASDVELRNRVVEGGLMTAEELDIDALAGTLEAWHRAAAERFQHGRPEERRSPTDRLDDLDRHQQR